MPRYVILEHDHPVLHWDLLLESDGVLKAWKLSEKPQLGKTIEAEASFDHRLLYLDYEGPVSGDRGTVFRWDSGEYVATKSATGYWQLVLQSNRWMATVELINIVGSSWEVRFDKTETI